MSIIDARKIIHSPEAFSKKLVRLAVSLIMRSAQATEEDAYWAGMADDI